jgi:acyl-CoA reductase-like NAD-dependent aldehyde dehydrogenase
MAAETQQGTPQFPIDDNTITPSTQTEMDQAVRDLHQQKDHWVSVGVQERIVLLDQLIRRFAEIAPRWVMICASAKGLSTTSPMVSDEWGDGAWPILMNLRQLRQSLLDIERIGHPRIPGPVQTRPDGQVVAQVFPRAWYDRIFLSGLKAEVWMEPGVTEAELSQTQAVIYQNKEHAGKVALVLGAGNVSSIGFMDVLYKLFVEDQVVLFKANPINAYTGPLLAVCFRDLIDAGFLRICYGGAEEGTYLCQHEKIDEVHITGSHKTFEAIVFGTGAEGAERKVARQPVLRKKVTGELGSVSPIIVVPGPWSAADLAYQAEHIATMLTNNGGFNCTASRVIIQHTTWPQRATLLQEVRRVFEQVPARKAFYPNAQTLHQRFLAAHPDAELFGTPDSEYLPWTLISDVDPARTEEICFTTEAFCSLIAETALPAETVVEYLERAVDFANQNLWGTLSATLIVHPASLKDPAIAAAVEQAIENLRAGSIGVNYWAGISFALSSTTWGAFPGHEITDIQTGIGVVHNTLMFSRPQKSVLRAPFRTFPKPLWFVSKGKAGLKAFPRLINFEAQPALWKLPGIIGPALTE